MQAKASLVADSRSPCHRTRRSAVLYVVLSSTLLTTIDPKKIEKPCSNSFCGLIFRVLRTQISSASITLSVFKQKEHKVALWRWIFLGCTQPATHPACTCVQQCPADRNRRHFVNSPHCRKQIRLRIGDPESLFVISNSQIQNYGYGYAWAISDSQKHAVDQHVFLHRQLRINWPQYAVSGSIHGDLFTPLFSVHNLSCILFVSNIASAEPL